MKLELWWDIAPYIALATAFVATWWRFRYDKFGWTSRSSQLYESRVLQIASPIFHVGILLVLCGHIIGLLIPESWTNATGMSNHSYHLMAVIFGLPVGLMAIIGLAILIYRRRSDAAVFRATTTNDKVMYVVLMSVLVAGLCCTLLGVTPEGEEADYRQSVSVWFRSIWVLNPRGDLMAQAPLYFQIHAFIALILIAMWPFTRLVHAFTASSMYIFRPYIVYRSRDLARPAEPMGSRPQRRGW